MRKVMKFRSPHQWESRTNWYVSGVAKMRTQATRLPKRLFNNGIDVVGHTPQEFAAMVKADMESKRKLLKQIGMLRQ